MNDSLKLPGAYGRNFGSKGKVQDSDSECETLQAAMGCGGGNVPLVEQAIVDDTYSNRSPRVYEECSPSLRAERQGMKVIESENQLRIRKLTPKECWRLMGFDDSDFEKAEKVNSNTQLYKQAGNSIVVDVLCYIFVNLLESGILGE